MQKYTDNVISYKNHIVIIKTNDRGTRSVHLGDRIFQSLGAAKRFINREYR
jgi:hypothetical protein